MTKPWPNKSPEPTAVGAVVPLSRFTSRVGGGSAFFVRQHYTLMSYITLHRASLEQRHYVTDATTKTMFFNFYESRVRDYIIRYQYAFCLVINGSTVSDDAFILPYKDFRDLFTADLLDETKRWVGNVRDEVIRISAGGKAQERVVHDYYNAFKLLQDPPLPLPKELDISQLV